jgi:hypothetical protein
MVFHLFTWRYSSSRGQEGMVLKGEMEGFERKGGEGGSSQERDRGRPYITTVMLPFPRFRCTYHSCIPIK